MKIIQERKKERKKARRKKITIRKEARVDESKAGREKDEAEHRTEKTE